MKFYTKMPKELKTYYNVELKNYRIEYVGGNLKSAWNHLERAHIIGQKYPFEHTFVHWKMLHFGFKNSSFDFWQSKSFVGKIPVGNPEGVNVHL